MGPHRLGLPAVCLFNAIDGVLFGPDRSSKPVANSRRNFCVAHWFLALRRKKDRNPAPGLRFGLVGRE
jgi:hypothetical protein